MFEKNDKSLLITRIILLVTTILGSIGCVIGAIILLVADVISVGICLLLLGPVFMWLAWVYGNLFLSFLCDVKLIRNKLYQVKNDNLSVFFERQMSKEAWEILQRQETKDKNEQERLRIMYDSGVITKEEYDNAARKFQR